MPGRRLGLKVEIPEPIVAGLAAIRTNLQVPAEFPAEVVAAAEAAAAAPRLPELDRTELEFVTIDPEGSKDLDQALHIARDDSGFVVSYAIADVAAFVTPGDPIDLEAHRRGETLYAPDHRTPLHPPQLSEGAASLLPDQVRPALLWTIRLDQKGKLRDAEVVRALVKSRRQMTYVEAQAEIDDGSASESLKLLKEVGTWREQRERDRGGVSLQVPEQEVNTEDGEWQLQFRSPLPVEGWNAQISLLTGMAAADIMIYGQIGILRTLPPADNGSLRRLRQTAKALHINWPAELDYPEFVRSLDPAKAEHAAMLTACTTLFRGASYRAFSGGVPDDAEHAALAMEYAHTTAPLRRLVDRYVGEICVSLCADQPVPNWVRQRLDALPEEMATADSKAKKYDRAIVDLVEAFLLADRIGETFEGTVVELDTEKKQGIIVIKEPAVEARITGPNLPLGHEIRAKLTAADPAKATLQFEQTT